MKKLTREEANTDGTHRVDTIYGVSYNELIETFGEPTYMPEDSADGKIQFEWVFDFEGNTFSVYDWKIYDEYYTKNELYDWHIGGNTSARDFKTALIGLISKEDIWEVQQ